MKTNPISIVAILIASTLMSFTASQPSAEWISLFDGRSLKGWKINEHPESFKVENGAIVVNGERSHMFYMGPVEDHNFKNFEFKISIMTTPGSNSGIYVHTAWQDTGWPSKGYEIQVNNSHTDWRRTGSVYAIQDVKIPPANDNEWFTEVIAVNGNRITIKVNDAIINDYTAGEGSKLSSGTFALQGHDPKSKVYYKDIMVRVLE